jgi:hypothetical protein
LIVQKEKTICHWSTWMYLPIKDFLVLSWLFRPIRLMDIWEERISQSFNMCQSLYTIGCQSFFISDRKAGFQLLVWTTREKMSEYDTNLYRIEVISVKPIFWELNRIAIKVFGDNSLKICNYFQILVESNFRTFWLHLNTRKNDSLIFLRSNFD